MPVINKTFTLTQYLRPERGQADKLRALVLKQARNFAVVEKETFTTIKTAAAVSPYYESALTAFWGLKHIDLFANNIFGNPYAGVSLFESPSTAEIMTRHPDLPLTAVALFCSTDVKRPSTGLINFLPDTQLWTGNNHNFLKDFRGFFGANIKIPDILTGMFISIHGNLSLVFNLPRLTDEAIIGSAAISGLWYGIDEVAIQSYRD